MKKIFIQNISWSVYDYRTIGHESDPILLSVTEYYTPAILLGLGGILTRSVVSSSAWQTSGKDIIKSKIKYET